MKILIVRTDKLGDFITALPTCKLLKSYDPTLHVSVCVAPLNRELAQACDFIDDVIVDDTTTAWELAKKLRPHRFDCSITLFSNTKVALAQWLASIPRRIAPATKLAQFFYTDRIIQRRSRVKMAEYEYNIALAHTLFKNLGSKFEQPLLRFSDEEREAAYHEFCTTHGVTKPVIAFHAGFGGSSDANWTLREYVELIRSIASNPNIQIIMTFGPDEDALRAQAEEQAKGLPILFYSSRAGLVAFAKLLASFRLFVSTSTGTYHLAAAVGTPTMTFFADTLFASVKRWKAVSEEQLQHPFMIPQDAQKRQALFLQVKEELTRLSATL